ncbi:MAG: toprim domain-containing protein [Paracoccus hibiscisoli]|uniref:DUF7146 domain-containing protein n=1 Tax=Paracoccus hibiscisoli TaxID=2023261 RepID=UPI00391CDCF2
MSDAQILTLALGGKWHRTYGLALCPAHGDRKPSLTLADAPDGRLLLHCKTGCGFTDVLDALHDKGLLDRMSRPQPPDAETLARREAQDRAKADRAEQRALATWREALPIGGTIAETYLRHHRGITCPLAGTLRFHPECWHPTARRFPAMVALVEGLPRAAIHRTYLRADGGGKADTEPAKAMQGATRGGAVRLTEGQGPLVVAEGIETALSLSSGLLRAPATVWAALSAPGLAALRLPDRSHRLTVAADGDPAGQAAATALAERGTALGWTVSLLPAPLGRDWNDVLTMKGASA